MKEKELKSKWPAKTSVVLVLMRIKVYLSQFRPQNITNQAVNVLRPELWLLKYI